MKIAVVAVFVIFLGASSAFAQAFGEYGRAVGNVPHGKGITGSGSSGGGRGNGGIGSVGDLGGRTLPTRLVVIAKNAGLFPRQDEESEKITQLLEGENLKPMVQSEGSNQWYMVRTEKGLVGWVKSVDVSREKIKN